MKTAAFILFVIMYIAMITKPKYRPQIALSVAVIYLIAGIVPFSELPVTINWNVLMMISGTMIIVYYFIDDFADYIVKFGGDNIFVLYTIIVWGSVIISAFVDNIPYVATMLPVLASVTASLGVEPYLLYFGLLSGATLGGNITPIGASANIAATGLLKKEGYDVAFKDFMRIGVPYTLTAVMAGYLYLWFVWG